MRLLSSLPLTTTPEGSGSKKEGFSRKETLAMLRGEASPSTHIDPPPLPPVKKPGFRSSLKPLRHHQAKKPGCNLAVPVISVRENDAANQPAPCRVVNVTVRGFGSCAANLLSHCKVVNVTLRVSG
jgi:hypothetical protein